MVLFESGFSNIRDIKPPILASGLPDTTKKSKRIPSIFNDESTGSFICLRRHIYMSHVNKVQLIRVKIICVAVIRAFQPIVVQKK
jgi:hypothetical protein